MYGTLPKLISAVTDLVLHHRSQWVERSKKESSSTPTLK